LLPAWPLTTRRPLKTAGHGGIKNRGDKGPSSWLSHSKSTARCRSNLISLASCGHNSWISTALTYGEHAASMVNAPLLAILVASFS
jgi:hypothetical protein